MTIKVGDRIPLVTLPYMDASGSQTISVDLIAFVSSNDAFVMMAWGKEQVNDKILILLTVLVNLLKQLVRNVT